MEAKRAYLEAAAKFQQELWASEDAHGFMPAEARKGATPKQIEALCKARYTLADFELILAGRLSKRTAGDLLTSTRRIPLRGKQT